MTITTVSPKFQVVIPKDVRERMRIRSGQKVTMVVKGDVIYIVPRIAMSKLKGSLRSMPTHGFRDKKDRL